LQAETVELDLRLSPRKRRWRFRGSGGWLQRAQALYNPRMETISTPTAPAAIGPYSQAIKSGGLVFCSGQIPLDPATMEMVGDTAAAQCEQVMRNLAAVLEAAGSSLADVVRATIFLASMDDFAAVNEVYGRHLGEHRPARATVAVKTLPKNALVEIDAIAETSV
jgi:2-iminobutanoate/2-iminopropanoate deaminase